MIQAEGPPLREGGDGLGRAGEREELVVAERVLNPLAELSYEEGSGPSSPNCRCRVIER
ncbi:hypothetical protein [Streptomyces cavernae]|uniref:hypothetical protein n=1 Tax=Streptomyces cavernae TaxID=2259034 RepID=UPI0012D97327|nr:hypothetical protein [Streptomyces cavernae]